MYIYIYLVSDSSDNYGGNSARTKRRRLPDRPYILCMCVCVCTHTTIHKTGLENNRERALAYQYAHGVFGISSRKNVEVVVARADRKEPEASNPIQMTN